MLCKSSGKREDIRATQGSLLQVDVGDLPELGDGEDVGDGVVGGREADEVGGVGHAVEVAQAAVARGERPQVHQLVAQNPAGRI